MEENTQLPKEVVEEINRGGQEMLAYKCDNKASYIVGATVYAVAYAKRLNEANETIKALTYDNDRLKGEVEGLKGMIMRHAIAFANWLLPSGCIANEKDYELFLMKPEAVLDESAAGREDAVELLRWLNENDWSGVGSREYINSTNGRILKEEKLYQEFKRRGK